VSPARLLAALAAGIWLSAGAAAQDIPRAASAEAAITRGEYVFRATGGCTCHTDVENDGPELAGGRPLATPFGTFFSTNITPDPETGIGSWSEAEFVRAMREGQGPDGTDYFPVFPYTSFTGMSDEDAADLYAYLRSLPAVTRENRPPDAWPPFSWRIAATAWKFLFFTPGRVEPEPGRDTAWNRGRYLSEALAHCGECHTPRTLAGSLDATLAYAGSLEGPEGALAPNITPDEETGVGGWSDADMIWFLQTALLPDGDDSQGLMREVIEAGYQHLDREDLAAIATYLRSLPPIENELVAPES